MAPLDTVTTAPPVFGACCSEPREGLAMDPVAAHHTSSLASAIPAGDARPDATTVTARHDPFVHVPLEQARPHAPQLAGDVWRSTSHPFASFPSQSAKPVLQTIDSQDTHALLVQVVSSTQVALRVLGSVLQMLQS